MSKETMCYIKQASSTLLKGKTDWHNAVKGKGPETQCGLPFTVRVCLNRPKRIRVDFLLVFDTLIADEGAE